MSDRIGPIMMLVACSLLFVGSRYVSAGRGDMRAIAMRPLFASIGVTAGVHLFAPFSSTWSTSAVAFAVLLAWLAVRSAQWPEVRARPVGSDDVANIAPLYLLLGGGTVMAAVVGVMAAIYAWNENPRLGSTLAVLPYCIVAGAGIGLGIWEEAFDRRVHPNWRPGFRGRDS